MKKHWLFILLVIVIPVGILIGFIGYKHYTTPYPVDTPSFPLTFTMTKLNLDGSTLGDCEVTITGSALKYPSGTACLDIELTGLSVQRKLRSLNDNDDSVGKIETLPNYEFQWGLCRLLPDGGFANLVFSPDYERWAILYATNEPFYVGSVDNKYTAEELYEYFGDHCISPWPYDPANALGRWVSPDGTLIENVDLKFHVSYSYIGETFNGISLNFTLPQDFPYKFTEGKFYQNSSEGIESMPYYTSNGYTIGKYTGGPELFQFAYDKEKNWAVFVWEDQPEQYLVISNTRKFDSNEILEHFKVFLDSLPYNK